MSRLSRLVPGPIRRRYLLKFVISILAVTLVIGAVGAVSYDEINRTVRDDATDQLASTAELQAEGIGDWVESMRVQTRTTSTDETLRSEDVQEVQGAIVESQARLSVDVRAIHVVNAETGTIETSTSSQYRDVSLESVSEPWTEAEFASELGNEEAVWNTEEAYESEALGDQVMAFASPVAGDGDRVVVLIGTLEYRVNQLDQPGAASTTMIVDGDRSGVLAPGSLAFDGDDLDGEAVEAALGGRMTVANEGDYVRAYVPVADTQWVAVSSVPTDAAYGVATDVGQNVLAMLLVSLLALGLVAVVLGRQTVAPLGRLRDRAADMERGDLEVDLETNRVDEIGQLFVAFDSMRTSLREQIREAERARTDAEQARAESEAMARHLETKADEYRVVMEEAADGDLTRRLDPESQSEAMTDIAHSFNAMLEELEETTDGVKRFAHEVATASEQVTASSEEVRSASEQVTQSIQAISDGADRQHEELQAVSGEMEGLSTTTEEIAASSNEVADIAARTAETGRRGKEAAQAAKDGMDEIEAESEEAVEAIDALEEEMAQIDHLVEFISDIARETNMLALNANIEASRGGTGGDEDGGFAVVAAQVKELAADAKETAEDIEERIESISSQTHETAAQIEGTATRIDEHSESIENAVTALDEIAEYAQRTNDGVQEISAATEEQAASTQEAVAMVSNATEISQATSNESQHVAAAAEEQTSAISEVTTSASSLTDQASQLSAALERFETNGASVGIDGPRAGALQDPDTAHASTASDEPLEFDDASATESTDDSAGDEPVQVGGDGDEDGDEPLEDAEDERETADDSDPDTEGTFTFGDTK
ncbi:methyl-accepting chemotaxis protein [Natronosalvus caseinilyticus]|uniref:methyl-accepting chemotaxis protein n=1 Tax=Natronosalvus caseinilyticus TaxID=2953747 RepID=UPI0028AEB05F|nr:methyl-accepting chemotaxis protein [Natronosalvus caseinilyticus]